MRLPIAPTPPADNGRSPTGLKSRIALEPRAAPVTVLLVDDEADARDVVRRILEQNGVEVFTAGTADEAFELLQVKRPTVLLSDIGMQGQDGYELIRRIRKLPPERGCLTPAVALTAFARSEDRMRALAAGFQLHLSKPVDPSELIVVLNSLTQRPTSPGRG